LEKKINLKNDPQKQRHFKKKKKKKEEEKEQWGSLACSLGEAG
jgi:hypothetical protein